MTGRVLLLATGMEAGGAESQVRQLAGELARRGWEVTVDSLLGLGAPHPLALARLLRLLRRVRPHVLHAHLFHANVTARAVRLLYPAPVVISTVHSMAETPRAGLWGGRSFCVVGPSAGHEKRWPALRDWAYRITDGLADATVCVSRAAAERHLAARAVSKARVRVIPNGVDTERFRPDAGARERRRRELGIGSEFVWLAAGRLMWKKDYPTMLRAMARQKGGVLLIAGAGPQEEELKALAREAGANARVLGPREDIPALLNAPDGVVLSSVVEGLPMVLLEAAASGVPSVAANVGGVAEAVLDGRTGFIVPPGDAAAFGVAMARLAALPPAARAEMGRAAREHACARFDLRSIAGEWERLYRELLESAARRQREWM
jgi:glycosyltransferase involved in cell wall biosynthesis